MSNEVLKKKFDERLKEISKYDESKFGYRTKDGRIYPNYFSVEEFEKLKKEMEKDELVYEAYIKGSGNELNEKLKSNVYQPPKMASIASSSRFIYSTFKDKKYGEKVSLMVDNIEKNGVFRFEDKISITNVANAIANLDASYVTIDKSKGVFFEAKCHEIFDENLIEFSTAYLFAGKFTNKDDISLDIDSKYLSVKINKAAFGFKGREKVLLNIKQFICHLLAIAGSDVQNKELVYLFYKPKELKEFDKMFDTLERQYITFCESKPIVTFCKKHKISLKLVYSTNYSFEAEFIPEVRVKYDY